MDAPTILGWIIGITVYAVLFVARPVKKKNNKS
jgi:hypothetical protein